jgi:Transient receptor potential (TRP) ion channel
LACVEADISNGKTVNQKGVAWAVAILTGLCLLASALSSGRGHFTTSAHVAAKTLAVFSYFQAQALLGMTSVTTPPIVRAWTQNFQWSMGIIKVSFLQRMATWYQRATGGRTTTLLSSLSTTSVHLQKRINSDATHTFNAQTLTLKGIARVTFLASIEITNTFFTSYIWFVVALLFVTIGVLLVKYICELLIKKDKMDPTKFEDFRNGWNYVLKGILFRVVRSFSILFETF